MTTILVHALSIFEQHLGRVAAGASDEELARGAERAGRMLVAACAALAGECDRLLVAPDVGPCFRRTVDTGSHESRREIRRPERAALRAAVAACREHGSVVEARTWPADAPPLVAGYLPAGRDVVATIAATWSPERGPLRIASERASLLACTQWPGVECLRDLREAGDRWEWRLWTPEEIAAEHGDPRLICEVSALASLPSPPGQTKRGHAVPGLGRVGARKLIAAHGGALATVYAASQMPEGERLVGTTGPQMAQLRAAAANGGASILAALTLHTLRTDAPHETLAARAAGRQAEAGRADGAPVAGAEPGAAVVSLPVPAAMPVASPGPVVERPPATATGPAEGSETDGEEPRERQEARSDATTIDHGDAGGPRCGVVAVGAAEDRAVLAGVVDETPAAPAPMGGAAVSADDVEQPPRGAAGVARVTETKTKEAPSAPRSETMSEQQNTNTQQMNPKAARAERIKRILRGRAKELAALFPRDGMTMVARAARTAVDVSMGLELNVSAESIAEAAIACHHLGLEVGDQAYVYPFKGQAKLTIGPRGLIALAYRGGEVKRISACSVFRGDDFTYDLGDDSIHHVKAVEGRRPRGIRPEHLITHTWAKIETRSEGTILEVLTAEDLGYYRGFSKASVGPWFDNYEGMARKTALKRVLEFVPRTALLSAALHESEEGTYEIPEEILAAVKRGQEAAREEPEQTPAAGYAEQEGAA